MKRVNLVENTKPNKNKTNKTQNKNKMKLTKQNKNKTKQNTFHALNAFKIITKQNKTKHK